MFKVNGQLVDALAAEYVATKKPEAFDELYREVIGYIRMLAQVKASKAERSGVHIPVEDFESMFMLALMDAANTYEPERGKFISRLNRLISRSYEPDVWRMYRTKGGDADKDQKRYDKARNDSLDRTIDAESGFTLGEAVLEPTASAEDEYFERETIEKTLADFGEVNKRYAKVITLIYFGATNRELAEAFGEREYNDKMRALVKRAKKSFRDFLYDYELA